MNRITTMYYGTRATRKRERYEMIGQILAGLFASTAYLCLWIVLTA